MNKTVFLLALTLPAYGTTLFSTFGASQTFATAGATTVSGPTSATHSYIGPAFSFTSGINFTVTQIDVAVSRVSGTGSATVELLRDSSGVPGSVLGSWAITSLPAFGTTFTAQKLTFPGIALQAGSMYWVAVLPGASNTFAGWNASPSNVNSPMAQYDGTTWAPPFPGPVSAFDIVGTAAVPEPASCILMSLGVAACVGFRRYRIGRQ